MSARAPASARPLSPVRARAIAALLFAALLAPSASLALNLPPSREARLPNGALLILAEKHELPLISVRATLRGGSLGDPPRKEGVADLTAGLLRKGAGKRSAPEIAALADGLGASLGTGAGLEASYLYSEFMTRDQSTMLDLIADLLRRPTFQEDEFEKLRAQTVDELTSEKDDPRNVIADYALAFFYGAHPYARPVEGDESTLKRLDRRDVLDYCQAHYGGDRLILTVVGDFDGAAMESKLRAKFGDWPKARSALPAAPAPAPAVGRRVLLVDKPDATQTYFWIGNLGVARNDPDRVALDIANTAYGGHYTSILNTALRIQGGLTYGARWVAPRLTQPGTVAISSYTKTETTAKAVDLALETLANLRGSGLDSLTIGAVKSYVLGQFPTRLETEDQVAAALGDLALYGQDRAELDQYAARVSALRPDAVNHVISRVYPSGQNLTFVFIGNPTKIRPLVKKYGPVTEIEIEEPLLARLRSTRP